MKEGAPVIPYGATAGLFACYVLHDALQESLFRTPGFVYGLFATSVVISVSTLLSGAFLLKERCATRVAKAACSHPPSMQEQIDAELGMGGAAAVAPGDDAAAAKSAPAAAAETTRSTLTLEVLGLFAALSLAVVVAQGASTAALQYVRMPVKVGFKCAKLIPTMLFGACLTGRRYSAAEYGAAVVLCTGLALMSLADYFDKSSDDGTQSAMMTGVRILIVAIVCDALVPNLQEKLLAQLKITMDAMVFGSNLVAVLILLATTLVRRVCFSLLASLVHEGHAADPRSPLHTTPPSALLQNSSPVSSKWALRLRTQIRASGSCCSPKPLPGTAASAAT